MAYIDTLTTTQVLANAKRIKAEIQSKQQELAHLTDNLAFRVGFESGKHTFATGSFTVSENNAYSEDDMKAALLPGQVRRVSVLKLDKGAVKRLYPEVYAAAKDTRGFKVSIS